LCWYDAFRERNGIRLAGRTGDHRLERGASAAGGFSGFFFAVAVEVISDAIRHGAPPDSIPQMPSATGSCPSSAAFPRARPVVLDPISSIYLCTKIYLFRYDHAGKTIRISCSFYFLKNHESLCRIRCVSLFCLLKISKILIGTYCALHSIVKGGPSRGSVFWGWWRMDP